MSATATSAPPPTHKTDIVARTVWIDLANSPHVPIFRPIVAELEDRGHRVVLTARDFAQTVPLARRAFGDRVSVVGGHDGAALGSKVTGLASRAIALARSPEAATADRALSFCSHAQNLAARLRRIPALTMMDYEGQPVNHLSFRCATRVVVPRAFPDDALRRFGARDRKVGRFDGLKEELYLSDAPAGEIGIDIPEDRVVVVLRPPATMAAYHRFENPLFDRVLDRVAEHPDAVGLILPRTPDQARGLEERGLHESLRVVREVPDGAALLAASDLVIGAGGTMNREAAVLGVPAYSAFAGAPAAVDDELIRQGRLVALRDERDLERIRIERRNRTDAPRHDRQVLDQVIHEIERFLEEQ